MDREDEDFSLGRMLVPCAALSAECVRLHAIGGAGGAAGELYACLASMWHHRQSCCVEASMVLFEFGFCVCQVICGRAFRDW
jgi:hypothetical protein